MSIVRGVEVVISIHPYSSLTYAVCSTSTDWRGRRLTSTVTKEFFHNIYRYAYLYSVCVSNFKTKHSKEKKAISRRIEANVMTGNKSYCSSSS